MEIVQSRLKDEIKQKIFAGFAQQAIQKTGIDGLSEEPISFEIFNGPDLAGALVVQPFWGQLHIKYLFVEEKYRNQGIGRRLMQHAFAFAQKSNMDFAFVETMCFQAAKFYQKMGFVQEFSRPGYAKNTTFHYLKKTFNDKNAHTHVSRMGVYGAIHEGDNMLLVQQKKGVHQGKFEFPGGGIEFGESPEQALHREFAEEIGMEFTDFFLINNLTAVTDVPQIGDWEPITFYQIGMIYEVKGFKVIKDNPELDPVWKNTKTLTEKQCSPLLWKHLLSRNHL